MKIRRGAIIFGVFVPLLMANSPSPYPFPDEYSDFTIQNETVNIAEEGTEKEITITGEIVNNGDGIISLENSDLVYILEAEYYGIVLYEYGRVQMMQGILPARIFTYEQTFPYTGSSPLGEITVYTRDETVRGFASDSFINDIVVTNAAIGNMTYHEEEENPFTNAHLTFDWDNPSETSSSVFYASFKIDDIEYIIYEEENLTKNDSGDADIIIAIPGDVEGEEATDITFTFLPRHPYYDNNEWGNLVSVVIVVIVVVACLLLFGPIIAIAIVLAVRAAKRKKNLN
ncbi:MAG: hypothetical protein WC344_04735 [Bacilli bacterium]|jgi:hypothetical protein